jgi:hypothetical protein
MENIEVIEQTLQNYELANDALLDLWEHLEPEVVDAILEKQQHRLEQIAQRLYHEEKFDEFSNETEVLTNTLARYEWANQYLSEHWETLPSDERLSVMQKQWNRLEEMRKRNFNVYAH